MDMLSRAEIETVLAHRLPNCLIVCTISGGPPLSVGVIGQYGDQFTIVNIERRQYHGDAGINKLVQEILQEMVLSRRTSWFEVSRKTG